VVEEDPLGSDMGRAWMRGDGVGKAGRREDIWAPRWMQEREMANVEKE
jgi:hypothetical protein